MPTLAGEYPTLIMRFAPVFSKRIWHYVQVLITGAILAPGKRAVTSVLRVMGLSDERHFQDYHRVLNRAVWSSLAISRVLLGLLVSAFAVTGPIVMGLDDTIERRRGAKIRARGIYRDPVRSSHSHMVQASGLEMAELDAACTYPLGQTSMGIAILDGTDPLGALPRKCTRAGILILGGALWAWGLLISQS